MFIFKKINLLMLLPLLTILGLCAFEVISSIDNAIINAEVLSTMGQKARKFFLFWGIIFAVFLIRGLLPWLIVWVVNPALGPIQALMATFSGDQSVIDSVEKSAPILLCGGGIFLVFLFFHWLFLEEKSFGLPHEKIFLEKGIWFYAVISIILTSVIWIAINIEPIIAFGAAVGSSAFFITHGFKQNAEAKEKEMTEKKMSDLSKIFYLEVIDATFSIDGVIGAFAFTLSVPLILLGNGLGAFVLRELTIKNVDKIKRYIYLKNGAMYSIFFLGLVMIIEGFGHHLPALLSPVITFG